MLHGQCCKGTVLYIVYLYLVLIHTMSKPGSYSLWKFILNSNEHEISTAQS